MQQPSRTTSVTRKTKETDISLSLNLDGQGNADVATGIPFFDHMLEQIVKHGCIDLELKATGDLDIDCHHTVEDIGICFGKAFIEAIGDKKAITRYAHSYVPLDESMSRLVIDLSGRAGLHYHVTYSRKQIGNFDLDLVREFFQAFVNNASVTLHIDSIRSGNAHHLVETIFKAFGKVLRYSIQLDSKMQGNIPSTKGSL